MEYRDLSKRIVAASLFLAGCGQTISADPVIESLLNKGPLQIEPDNPYLAVNKFLKAEMAKSSELAGFISLKGYPVSLELHQGSFTSLGMTFLYPRERYEIERSNSTWIITGPFADSTETPRLQPTPFAHASPTRQALPTPTRRSTPRVVATPALPGPTSTALPEGMFVSPEPTIPVNSDAIGQAEISPRGDLVHYVTVPGESLSIIARWYTEDRSNAPKLGRLNQLKSDNQLEIGDQIIIPGYMIKNKMRLTEEGVRRLQDVASQEKRQNAN